jgi:hypothetical protein
MCVMLKKITFFSGAIALSSLVSAMENSNCGLVSFNQTSAMKDGGYTMSTGMRSFPHPIINPGQQRKIKKSTNAEFVMNQGLTHILLNAADQEMRKRDLIAQQISHKLNVNYVGVGDRWSPIRHTFVTMNARTGSYESPRDIIVELNQLGDFVFDKFVIKKVKEINGRFACLLDVLVIRKMWDYARLEQCFPHDYSCCLQPEEIDSFFDEKNPHNELNPSLQKYVQEAVESKYKNIYKSIFPFSDEPHAAQEHALRKSAEYAMHLVSGINWLKELLKTKTFKNLPSDRKSEVRKHICGKIQERCTWDSVTYHEGKFCDGDELKQECK